MRTSHILITGVSVLAGMSLAAAAHAGGEDRLGTAGASELRIPVGTRALALGGAVVSDAAGVEAMFYNPAGIAQGEGTDIVFDHMTYLNDMKVEFAGLTSHAMGGTIGASFKALQVGDIIVTTENAPDGTGEISSPVFSVAQLGYARQMTDHVRVGGSMAIVSERVLQESATGLSFDFGFQYDPLWKGLTFGFAMKNIGPNMKFGGADLERSYPADSGDPNTSPYFLSSSSAAFELPSYVSFGAAKAWNIGAASKFTLGGVYQNNNFSSDEYRAGGEYLWNNQLALRGGYVASNQDGYLYDWTAGAGWQLPLGRGHASVDYTYRNVAAPFDANQMFSVSLKF